MRKAFVIFVLVLLVGMATVIFAHASLSTEQDNVEITESDSFGNLAETYNLTESVINGSLAGREGLTVSLTNWLSRRLVWETDYTFGKIPAAKTGFTFSSKELNWPHRYTGEILSLGITSSFSASSNGDLLGGQSGSPLAAELAVLGELFRDIASRTPNGAERTEQVNFRDYYEFYPLNAYISPANEAKYYFLSNGSNSQLADSAQLMSAFSEYFKIPVPDEHMLTVSVRKDSAGNVVELSQSQGVPVGLHAISVDTDDGVYFALRTDGVTDFSGIKGGFGLYLLPAATFIDSGGKTLDTLDYNNIRTVYPLTESVIAQQINLSPDGKSLNLLTIEQNTLFLTVLDLKTMTERQKLPLIENLGDMWPHNVIYQENLLLVILGDSRFALTESVNGEYSILLTGSRDLRLLNEEIFDSGYYSSSEPVFAWDGRRLAIVTPSLRRHLDDGEHVYYHSGCGFAVEIYTAEGLVYKGLFESSLDQPGEMNGKPTPVDSSSLAVSW